MPGPNFIARLAMPLVKRWGRFVVAEESMLPHLRPGDGLVTYRSDRIRRGELRVFEHPRRPGFWLVKRVGDITMAADGSTVFTALSDNAEVNTIDSRQLGRIDVHGSWRVVLRVPRRVL